MSRRGKQESITQAAMSKKEKEEEKPKTLDLLDDLLYTIHSTRANVLMSRARKYEKRLEKRKEKAKMMTRRNRDTFIDETEADAQVDDLINEMASEFSAPAPVPHAKELRSLEGLNISKSATAIEREPASMSMKGAANSVKAMVKSKKGKKVDISKPAKLFQGSQQAFHNESEQQVDLLVVEIYGEFKDELSKWFHQDPVRRNDLDQRGEMADYLSDHYLSKKLDPLPPSKVTSTYRKYISKIIEELASSSGNLPSNWCELAFDSMPAPEQAHLKTSGASPKEQLKQMGAKHRQLQKELGVARQLNFGADDDDNDEGTGKRKQVKFADNDEESGGEGENEFTDAMRRIQVMADKEERSHRGPKRKDPEEEKERIKKQYELYNRKKKELEAEGKPDEAQAKERSLLQDDIRSLLSTIQQRPTSPGTQNYRSSMGDGIN